MCTRFKEVLMNKLLLYLLTIFLILGCSSDPNPVEAKEDFADFLKVQKKEKKTKKMNLTSLN